MMLLQTELELKLDRAATTEAELRLMIQTLQSDPSPLQAELAKKQAQVRPVNTTNMKSF